MPRTETPMTSPALVILRRQLAEARRAADECSARRFREEEEHARLAREAESCRISAAMSAQSQETHEATARELEAAIEALTGEAE